MIYTGKVISKFISKKGSTLCSIFKDENHLVDNCVVSNPLKLDIKVGSIVEGQMIFNRDSINTFVLTEIK